MAISGRHVRLYGNAGSKSSPRWVVIDEEENVTVNRSRSSQTVSHKDSATDVVITGNKSITIELSGFRVRSSEGLELVRRAFESDQELEVRLREFGGDLEGFNVRVTNYSESFPVGGAQQYTASMAATTDPVRLGG